MRIIFMGSSQFALPTLASIDFDRHDIALVVTQPDRPKGRGKEMSPTPVKAEALRMDLPVIAPQDVNAADVVQQIKGLKADLAYVAAFGQRIGRELLSAFPAGIVNLHASLLPAWRGAAPIQRAVMNGDDETGVTVFRLVEKMDAGPILIQRRTAIGDIETADELHERLSRIGCDAVRTTLELLAKTPSAPGCAQDESSVTHARKLKKADGHICFDQTMATLSHQICGLWSWPGATCRFVSSDSRRDEVVMLARARPYEGKSLPARSPDDCGRITDMLTMQVADGEVEVLEIKPSGSALMDWRDFVNGRHVKSGDRFLPIEAA